MKVRDLLVESKGNICAARPYWEKMQQYLEGLAQSMPRLADEHAYNLSKGVDLEYLKMNDFFGLSRSDQRKVAALFSDHPVIGSNMLDKARC